MSQYNLALISHEVDQQTIYQRASDGYFNATAMCKATGKKISHYFENSNTKAFLNELSSDAGIPASVLVQALKCGNARLDRDKDGVPCESICPGG